MPASTLFQHIRVAQGFSRPSARLSVITVFTALSLGTNYTLTGLPNVKLMDTFAFVATYLFGLSVGLPVVILTRTIYASVNPWGPASGGLIGMLVAGDCLYVVAGYLGRKFWPVERGNGITERLLSYGFLGFFSALGFDLITNFASGLIAVNGPDTQTYLSRAFIWGLVTMNFPLPMGILHEASDFVFFSTVAPPAISLIKRSSILEQVFVKAIKRPEGVEQG